MVLALANGRQLTQTLDGGGVEALQLVEHSLALGRELALGIGIAQGVQRIGVVALADEPA